MHTRLHLHPSSACFRWHLSQQLVGAAAELMSLRDLVFDGGSIDAASLDLHALTGMYVCMCVYMYLYVYVCMCMYVCMYV